MPAHRHRPPPPPPLLEVAEAAADDATRAIERRVRRLAPAGRMVVLDHLRHRGLPEAVDELGREAVDAAISEATSARELALDIGWSISTVLEAFGRRGPRRRPPKG